MISQIWPRLRWHGLQWLYRQGYELLPVVHPFVAQKRLVPAKKSLTIFDVGAHAGESAREYARYFSEAIIHSFEPRPESFQQLVALQSVLPRLKPHALAIDATCGTREFRVRQWDYASSFYENADRMEHYHPGSMMQTTQALTVATTTLDHFCEQQNIPLIDILKLDIQGAELAALEGAEKLLSSQAIRLIYCEVEFVELYRGQPLYHEIAGHLRKFNYRLWNLYNLVHEQDELVYADAIFIPARTSVSLA